MRIQTGDLVIDTDTRSVEVGGVPVRLTSKEFRILELLSTHKGVPLSRAAIAEDLYGADTDPPELRIIDLFVATLRKKLATASGGPGSKYIVETWKGVRLNDAS